MVKCFFFDQEITADEAMKDVVRFRMGLFYTRSGFRLQASGMGLFYIRVNVKALVTSSITKWSPNFSSGVRLQDELIIHVYGHEPSFYHV